MDDRFMLPLAEGITTVFQTIASSDGLAWATPAWYRYFGDGVAGGVGGYHRWAFLCGKDRAPYAAYFPAES
jgi:hypothetical protein